MPRIGKLKNGDLTLAGSINERIPSVTNGLLAYFPLDYTVAGEDWLKRRNLLKISQWKLGTSGSQGDFLVYTGSNANNTIIKNPNPWNIDDIIWAGLSNSADNSYQTGWRADQTNNIIDPTKTYRFSVWVKRTDMTSNSGRIIFTTGANQVSKLGSTDAWSWPYFFDVDKTIMSPHENKWLLFVGHVFPHNYGGLMKHTDSGIYDISGNKIYNGGEDFKWLSTNTKAGHGVFLYGSTIASEKQYFYQPRIELADGHGSTILEMVIGIQDKIRPVANIQTLYRSTGLSIDAASQNLANSVPYDVYAHCTLDGDYYALPNPEDKLSKKYTITSISGDARGQKILPAVTGKTYTMSLTMKITGDGNIIISPGKPFPEAGNTIVLNSGPRYSIDLGGGWYRLIQTHTVTSNTATSCILQFGIASGAIGDQFYVYDLQWEEKDHATSYMEMGSRFARSQFILPRFLLQQTCSIIFEFMPRVFVTTKIVANRVIPGIQGFELTMQSTTSGNSSFSIRNGSTDIEIVGNWFPNLYKWYKVCITLTINGSANIYIDGVSVGNIPNIGDWYTGLSDNIYIGGISASPGSFEFKNIGLYDRALSAAEIEQMHTSKIFKTTSDGSMYMKLIEKPIGIPSDAYHWPLGENTFDVNYRFDAVVKSNLVFRDGYAWVPTAQTQLFTTYPQASSYPVIAGDNWETMVFEDGTVIYKHKFKSEQWNYKGNDIPITLGNTYFFSIDIFLSSDFNGNYALMASIENYGAVNFTYDKTRLGTWQRFTHSFTAIATATSRVLMYPAQLNDSASKGYVLYRNPMFTETSYEVPFHRTVRPRGNLEFNLNATIGLNWSGNWTIIYWKIPKGTNGQSRSNYSIESLGSNGNTVGGGYRWWGKIPNQNQISVTGSGATTYDPVDFWDKPHMISIVKTGSTVTWKFWGIGSAIITVTDSTISANVANYFVTSYGYDLKLGGYDHTQDCNTMFKDLIVLKRALPDADIELLYRRQYRIKDGKMEIQGAASDGYIF